LARICPPSHAWILRNPLRKLFSNRPGILEAAGIDSGSVVLEVGAGNGFFTEIIARTARKVIAVELQEDMAEKLYKALEGVLPNSPIEIRVADIATIRLAPRSVDVAFLYYSFHEILEQETAASNIARTLKVGGRLAVYEPVIEVKEDAMARTVSIFEQRGFVTTDSGKSIFTRWAIMRKEAD